MNVYFIKLNGKIFGPFSGRKLQSMKNAGLIREDTPVSSDRSRWQPAVDLPWLYSIADAPPVTLEPESGTERIPPGVFRSGPEGSLPPQDKLPEVTEVSSPDCMEFFAREISLIWNPAYHVAAIRDRFGEKGCLWASVIALLFFSLSTSLSLNLFPAMKQLSLSPWKTVGLPLFLVLFLTLYTTFVRLFFGNEGISRIRASDFLTATASLVCWGVLIPFAGVLCSYYWKPAGTAWMSSGYFVLHLLFFCCGAIVSTLCFYESWTGFGFVKKTTAVYLLPFVFFFSIFLVIVHF